MKKLLKNKNNYKSIPLSILLIVTLTLGIMAPVGAYTHTDSTSLAESYWGRTLVNNGTSAFIHPVNAYGEAYKEAMIVNEDTDYAWTNTSAYFQYEFTLDNDLEETASTVITDAETTADWSITGGGGAIATDADAAKGTLSVTLTRGTEFDSVYNPAGTWNIAANDFVCLYLKADVADTVTVGWQDNVAVNSVNYTAVLTTSWQRFVIPIIEYDGATDKTQVTSFSIYDTAANNKVYIDRILIDVGNWVTAELNTPNMLGQDVNSRNIVFESWTGGVYVSFAEADIKDSTDLTRNLVNVFTLDGSRFGPTGVYGSTTEGMNIYEQNSRGTTEAVIFGGTGAAAVTYSNNLGATNRTALTIKLPPDDGQDSATTGISQTQLRIRVTYDGQATELNEGPEYGYQAYVGDQDMVDYNWTKVDISQPLTAHRIMENATDLNIWEDVVGYYDPVNSTDVFINRTAIDDFGLQFGNIYNASGDLELKELVRTQLREHKHSANPTKMVFSQTASNLTISSATTDYGMGYAFWTVDRAWLNDTTLEMVWSGTVAATGGQVLIYDGSYMRYDQTSFPDGAAFVPKGAGLLQTAFNHGATFGSTNETVLMNLAGSTEDYCTIFIRLYDSSAAAVSLNIDALTIRDGVAGPILAQQHFTSAIVMELDTTEHDYGYEVEDLNWFEYETVTLTLDTNYWRMTPFYNIYLLNEDGTTYSNSTVTVTLTNLLNGELTYYQTPSPTGFGLYTQPPSTMVIKVDDGTYNFNRTKPVTASYESIYFYIGDPQDMFFYDIWITEPFIRYTNGELYVYKRTPITKTLVDISSFNSTLTEVALTPDTYYYFEVRSTDGFVYTYGVWYTTGYSLTINIISIPMDPLDKNSWKFVDWRTSRLATDVLNQSDVLGTIVFQSSSDAMVRLYNATGTVLDTQTYSAALGINYVYIPALASEAYYIRLNASVPGYALDFDEMKIVGRMPDFGQTAIYPIDVFGTGAGYLPAQLIFACVVAMIGLSVNVRNRAAGIIMTASFTAFFVYNGWLDVDSVIMYVATFIAIIYALGNRGDER